MPLLEPGSQPAPRVLSILDLVGIESRLGDEVREVIVFSPNLENDASESETTILVLSGVKKNLARGIRYRYIIPKECGVRDVNFKFLRDSLRQYESKVGYSRVPEKAIPLTHVVLYVSDTVVGYCELPVAGSWWVEMDRHSALLYQELANELLGGGSIDTASALLETWRWIVAAHVSAAQSLDDAALIGKRIAVGTLDKLDRQLRGVGDRKLPRGELLIHLKGKHATILGEIKRSVQNAPMQTDRVFESLNDLETRQYQGRSWLFYVAHLTAYLVEAGAGGRLPRIVDQMVRKGCAEGLLLQSNRRGKNRISEVCPVPPPSTT